MCKTYVVPGRMYAQAVLMNMGLLYLMSVPEMDRPVL